MPGNRASFRGIAGPASATAGDPLLAISQPLLLPKPDDTPPDPLPWAQAMAGNGGLAKLLRSKRAFGVGGLELVRKCGLVQDWYNDDANRRDALTLIDQRGQRGLLDELADKDMPTSIFGKNDVRDFFKTFPPVDRPGAPPPAAGGAKSMRFIRKEHPLRLRKVIEFLFLTEAVLRFRFRTNETKARFQEATGAPVTNVDDAQRIWSHMWIEPLLYVLEPEPRRADIDRILRTPSLLADFRAESGQAEEVLYWALVGAPCTYHTAKAAADVCTRFYNGGAPTYAVVVNPELFDERKLRLDLPLHDDYVPHIENVVRLTP